MAVFQEQEYNKPFDLTVWKKMLPFLRPYYVNLFIVIVLNIVMALIDISMPLFQRYTIDHYIGGGTLEGIGWFTALYGLAIVFQTVVVIICTRQSMFIEMKTNRDMKRACFVHLQTLSFSFYNVTPIGYLIARVMSDTGRISGMLAWGLMDVMWSLVYVLGVFAAMLMLNWKLALLIMLIVPLIAVLTVYFQNKILHWNRKTRRINSQITGAFNEGISGARTSKTLVIEEHNINDFKSLTADMRQASIKTQMLSAVYIPSIMFLSSLATALVLARGGYLSMQGLMEIGTLSAFTSYAVGIFEPIQQIARILADIISAQANIERVCGLLEEVPAIQDTPEVVEKYGDNFVGKTENWEPIRGDIEFRDVTFRYPDGSENILEHFNLKIPAGTTVAIVGETGAGKSTLVNLACRFFEPTAGTILIDGKDYRERSQLWLHSNIGYVLQNPHLFSGSIKENIRYGRLDATDEQIEAAAKAVSADTVVEKLENGYDSDVGEGGDRLSTGEKQLISFARAVLADPAIFVLDEATSSIDTQTEQLIQNAIAHLLKGRTSFLIAHRLSTIRHADIILVVKDGKIIESGSHEDLLRKKGYYFSLYTKQFEKEASAQLLRS
ncbi:MAG: ABC transporter ATP-binding protein/permease [Oscillospiraceae bacterium]|nr:ABC transporter ATP-binding protein/permease [Oscillospiraceae bacterium]